MENKNSNIIQKSTQKLKQLGLTGILATAIAAGGCISTYPNYNNKDNEKLYQNHPNYTIHPDRKLSDEQKKNKYFAEKRERNLQRLAKAETYGTEALDKMTEEEFGDKDFNTLISTTRINGTEYVWIPLNNRLFTVNGRHADPKNYFPFGALERNMMVELIDPTTGTVNYTCENDEGDSIVKVFKHRPKIRKLVTGLRAKPQKMPRYRRVGKVTEPAFEVPLINFDAPGYSRVAYAGTQEGLALAVSPRYGINHKIGSVIEYRRSRGGIYVDEIGTFITRFDDAKRTTFSSKDFIGAEIIGDIISSSKPGHSSSSYTVKQGNGLGNIAKEHATTVNEIMELNPNIKNKDRIYTGQEIKIK